MTIEFIFIVFIVAFSLASILIWDVLDTMHRQGNQIVSALNRIAKVLEDRER